MTDLRIVVAAADVLAAAGLAAALERHAEIHVIDRVPLTTLRDAVAAHRPDAAVVDLGLVPPGDRLPLESLLAVDVPVVALVTDEVTAREVRAAGARGVVDRSASPEVMAAALTGVAHDLVVIDPDVVRLPGVQGDPPIDALTPREIEVLELVADGQQNKAIARQLDISENTVKSHLNAVLRKLDAHSRTEAAVRAARLGIVQL